MKHLTLLLALLVSITAQAGTVERTVKVNGVEFVKTVVDNGWRTSGQISPGPVELQSNKSLILTYSIVSSTAAVPASLRTDLFTEARSSCQEIGDQEIATQTPSKTNEYVVRGSAELGNSFVEEGTTPSQGTFVCIVKVTAKQVIK